MSPGVNRETVERRRERLLSEYDGTHVQDITREFDDAEAYREFRAKPREGYTGGGYAWVVRDPEDAPPLSESMPDDLEERRSVLMIRDRGGSRWGLLEGGHERDETYEQAARREVREETAVECELRGLFLLRDLTLSPPDGVDGDPVHTLWALFDAAYTGGTVAIQAGELNGAAWFEDPPELMHPENVHRAREFWEHYVYDGDPFEEFYGD
jgi:8-oxo-dGTP pyrophosphatase MutT (NUDIX family)